jgi:hypothetical protein
VTSLASFDGELYAATGKYRLRGSALPESPSLTPGGRVFRRAGGREWIDCGKLGESEAVSSLAVYRRKLYAGTLPLAEVYRYDGDGRRTSTGRLDTTPDVTYRRAWSMAVFRGRLFCGTLPAGRVFALAAGRCVTWDFEFPAGWHHVAAVRGRERLRLYVDGKLVAESELLGPSPLDISSKAPLRIAAGPHEVLHGALRDARLYGRALTPAEVAALAKRAPKSDP